jgi:hypothetical protein
VLRDQAAQTPELRVPPRILDLEMDAGALRAEGALCKIKSSDVGSAEPSVFQIMADA